MADAISVLIIDDSEDDRFAYKRALKAGGRYQVAEAVTGEDGLLQLEQSTPDCVLLDYSLPGRNGGEILKRIRTKHPFLPVLVLTSRGDERLAVSMMQEGAQNYLNKANINADFLPRNIHVAIEHCALRHRVHDQRASLELFTHALAHDLKEPVRTIRSFVDLLSNQELPPDKTQQYFRYVRQAAERMGNLIDSVYFYLRLDQASADLAREACDSQSALFDALENLTVLIKERDVKIYTETLPVVMADPTRLIQVFQNLIGNAIKHGADTPVIRVDAKRDNKQWLFRVTDNGAGIDEEYAEVIFEPFKRLSQRHSDGMGIGLSICKKIITSFGGRIWVEPALPHGACFCFTLDAAKNIKSAVVATSTEQTSVNKRQPTLLVVDDNEADVELVRYALFERQNIECHLAIAHNGLDALSRLSQSLLEKDPVDLVLLDINMPGLDGFELLSRIRADNNLSQLPVIMCSTSSYDVDMQQAKLCGANGYIVKPFDFDKLRPFLSGIPTLLGQLERALDEKTTTANIL